jgi:hypothetical protein
VTTTRRLAAILAADVAGYSRLMEADEEGTHERLKTLLRQLVDPKVKEHLGRIVKKTGDGMLVEFGSIVGAVRFAAEIQQGMNDCNTPPSDRATLGRSASSLGSRFGQATPSRCHAPSDAFSSRLARPQPTTVRVRRPSRSAACFPA